MSRERPRYYRLLPDHSVEPCTLEEWATTFEKAPGRVVAYDELGGGVKVSTVFLGLDHSWRETGPAILFETMICGGRLGDTQERYATWDEAVAGHAKHLALAKEHL